MTSPRGPRFFNLKGCLKLKNQCPLIGRAQLTMSHPCPHARVRAKCAICRSQTKSSRRYKSSKCPHGRKQGHGCMICRPETACPHGYSRKRDCLFCRPETRCPHGYCRARCCPRCKEKNRFMQSHGSPVAQTQACRGKRKRTKPRGLPNRNRLIFSIERLEVFADICSMMHKLPVPKRHSHLKGIPDPE